MILRCKLNRIKKVLVVGLLFFIISNIFWSILKMLSNTFTFHFKQCVYEEPIDVVYTWVNGSDPLFIQNLNRYLKSNDYGYNFLKQRYDDKYELKFSLRSLEKYAPWINHVYIVTNGQIPYWLNLDYEKVTVVTHEEIFRDVNNLPTFSSPAIEYNLHRISGLSKKFIYFNDDIFLGSPTYLEDFYTANKGYLIYLAWPLPNCAPNCPWLYVSDGQCDKDCYTVECQMDGNDCLNFNEEIFKPTVTPDLQPTKHFNEGKSLGDVNKSSANFHNVFMKKLIPISQGSNNQLPLMTKEPFFINKIRMSQTINLTKLVQEHNKKILEKNKTLKKYKYKRKLGQSRNFHFNRKYIDAYSASLQHTNRMFNKKFRFITRKVPSHAPILIDVDIMEDLYLTFTKEFHETEKHRFRSPNDVQFSFSYYYFIMSEVNKKSIEDIFNDFDTDESGTWSDRELRTLLSKLYELPLSYTTVDHFEAMLRNCSIGQNIVEVSTPLYERYIDSVLPTISRDLVRSCSFLTQVLIEKFGSSPKHAFEIVPNSEEKYVSFKMLNSNISDLVNSLDDVRSNQKKFVCLNDNLDESKESENEVVRAILYDFYISLFPLPSKFELPTDYRNRFTHMHDLNKWKSYHYKIKLLLYCIISVLLYLSVCSFCKKKCCQIINKLFC